MLQFFTRACRQRNSLKDVHAFQILISICLSRNTSLIANPQIQIWCPLQEMILQIPQKAVEKEREKSWREQLMLSIYQRNQQMVNPAPSRKKRENQEIAGRRLVEYIESQKKVEFRSQYAIYVPLQAMTRFNDELVNTFPYLNELAEKGHLSQKAIEYDNISSTLLYGKQYNCLQQKWRECLQHYIATIDSLQAVQAYSQLLKNGHHGLNTLYESWGLTCDRKVFYQKVYAARVHYQPKYTFNQKIPLSIGENEPINSYTINKTSKQLFCEVCLIYDCSMHPEDITSLTENIYLRSISPKNMRSKDEDVNAALQLCDHYFAYKTRKKRNNQSPETKLESSDEDEKQSTAKGRRLNCSIKCYLSLTSEREKQISSLRALLVSPLLLSFVSMGIQMFGYDPCKISTLFQPSQRTSISCSLIFLYLIEEIDLYRKIERKLFDSEVEELIHEKSGVCHNGSTRQEKKEKFRKKKRKETKIEIEKVTQPLSACKHYFINEEPIDQNCDNCNCRRRGFCLPECLCKSDCQIRLKGCLCKEGDCCFDKCTCFRINFECNPSTCRQCFGCNSDSSCRNNHILLKKNKLLRVGYSLIPGAGYGIFAGQDVQARELVTTYTGELIEKGIEYIRHNTSQDSVFYNFDSPQGIIDSKYMGNKARFINHGNQNEDNIRARNMFSGGKHYMAFYAIRNISRDEELYFDYDGNGELFNNHHDKYPFIQKKN